MTRPKLLEDPALAPVLAALPAARLVGGCVRDMLAGRPVADIDLATPDPPETVQRQLEQAGIRVIPTGLAHGTVTALSRNRPVEITTLRRDLATDGRHATVAWTSDFEADAARRDFTINAMSLDRQGVLYDYFGGQADLAAGRVRFVGDAATRIAEDYLRVLRYFRFFARYGAGDADAAATQAIAAATGGLASLSAERVWSELKRILAGPDAARTLALMERLGVLGAVLPEAQGPALLAGVEAAGAPADPLLRLAALLRQDGDAAAAAADRLKLSGAERATLLALKAGPVPDPAAARGQLARLLADTPAETLIGRSWLADPLAGAPVRARLAGMDVPHFPLEGRHALALGAAPGPAIGAALRAVRGWWLEQECKPDEPACLERLRQALSAGAGQP